MGLDICAGFGHSGLQKVEKDMRRREFLAGVAALTVAPILSKAALAEPIAKYGISPAWATIRMGLPAMAWRSLETGEIEWM